MGLLCNLSGDSVEVDLVDMSPSFGRGTNVLRFFQNGSMQIKSPPDIKLCTLALVLSLSAQYIENVRD